MVVQEAKAAKTAEMAVAVVNQEGAVDVKEEAADQEEAEVAQAALTCPHKQKSRPTLATQDESRRRSRRLRMN